MTNKEAIRILKKELEGIPRDIDKSEFEQALDFVIKAIKALNTIISIVDDSENLISDRYGAIILEGYADVVDEIKKVIDEYREERE